MTPDDPVGFEELEAQYQAHRESIGAPAHQVTTKRTIRRARDIRSAGFDREVIEQLLVAPSEKSVALAFVLQFHDMLVFSHTHGKWFEWDLTRWKANKTQMAFDFAGRMATASAGKAATIRKASFARGVEAFAKADPRLARDGVEFDANNYLLNCPQITYDLRANTDRPNSPADNITQVTAVTPSPDGGKAFRKFMREITLDDEDLEAFLQISLGACLSGAVEDHWLMFWIGSGRNGKNTLADLVQYVLGDYARKIPASVLMTSVGERHPTELANLQGARLAIASEIEDGSFWAEAKIKELTGDATISARFMRGDYFQFSRTHKHLVLGNHRPQIRSVDAGLKSRLKIVPFKANFAGREDTSLPERLRKEAAYVLNWLMLGHRAWLDQGRLLGTCAAVDAETDDYFASQSTVDMWVDENCTIIGDDGRGATQWQKASVLYKNYSDWKKDRGEQPISQTRWGGQMRVKKVKANGIRYVGIEIKFQI